MPGFAKYNSFDMFYQVTEPKYEYTKSTKRNCFWSVQERQRNKFPNQ